MIPSVVLLTFFSILEGSFISFPLTFLFLVFFSLRNRTPWIFFLAFLGGILLDSFYLRALGTTSIFFLIFLFATLLYERKFEIRNYLFLFLSVLLGSFLYLSVFQNSFVWQKTLVVFVVVVVLTKIFTSPKIDKSNTW